jgi:hypothetical protein
MWGFRHSREENVKPQSRDRDGIGRRNISEISHIRSVISLTKLICSCPISQVWARGITKKRYPYPARNLKTDRLGFTTTWL